ncbi:MAG: DNA topoisomerase IV subunit B [Rhodospirillaceae bacterium]|nr:DNA topoisomerase IV subunit B [Rhodospirillaceae bacterium]
MKDLFQKKLSKDKYTAKDIEILEGLEPVRRRPGMYIGGTDEKALHHLVAEILDNAMDEAVAGYATQIELHLNENNEVTIKDNGRGIPIDPHPKFPKKSALEVIMTTLHSGGKFTEGAYQTSGGLNGVGISVVNALSEKTIVEVARDKNLWRQSYSKGSATTQLEKLPAKRAQKGTIITFKPDSSIFIDNINFKPSTLYKMARSKAYLFEGVKIRWCCATTLLGNDIDTPESEEFHFPNGLQGYLAAITLKRSLIVSEVFAGSSESKNKKGRVDWAILWPVDEDGFLVSYCNTIPTPEGGTHENSFRLSLTKALKTYGEMTNIKRASTLIPDDVVGGACGLLSLFISEPQFQGQTKEKLNSPEAARLVESIVKDHFEHWLTGSPNTARKILEVALTRAETRLQKKEDKDLQRKTATKRLRLPGKLSDCSRATSNGTELFIVEGDSAGGSAKQARNRETQAILPLRGKILNVASATHDKLKSNQELQDLFEALGCGRGKQFDSDKLRYEKIIIMTDADVDGAHIAALLITFFFKELIKLIELGKLYIAMPPLYRITQKGTTYYAMDDTDKENIMNNILNNKSKVEVSRFKGLGEMPPAQLRETTMDPSQRTLFRITVPTGEKIRKTETLVEELMGRRPEPRFHFIQKNAEFVKHLDI